MSRNRNRGRRPESTVPAVEAATAPVAVVGQPSNRHERRRAEKVPAPTFVFSRPVVVDGTKATIDDMVLLSEISAHATKGDVAAGQAILTRVAELRDMFNRVIKGGTVGRPAAEFFPLLQEVMAQFGALGNPGN